MHISHKRAVLFVTALATITLSPISAHADEASPDSSAITKYETNYFTKFTPQTLQDMIEKIPGTNSILNAINNNDNDRGFGSGGDQILINGKRTSGKSNGIKAELQRIQAKNVQRIELIRGTVAGLDVQSEGLIINVILKEDVASSTIWDIGYTATAGRKNIIDGGISHSGAAGDLKYTLGIDRRAYPNAATYSETFRNPDGSLNHTRIEKQSQTYATTKLSGKIEYDFTEKTNFRLNGVYDFQKYQNNSPKIFSYAAPMANPKNVTNILNIDNTSDKWELGGDLIHKFESLGTFKLLFISTHVDFKGNLWIDKIADGAAPYKDFSLLRSSLRSENIIRTTLNKELSEKHSFEIGAELAINKRAAQLTRQSSNPESHDIKETRYEAFLSHNFKISSDLNLQSSLNSEWSKISVDSHFFGAPDLAPVERSFNYLKPRFNLRYDLTKKNQLRFNIERTVSQLRLGNFVPDYNREEARIELTNPDLRPEKRWELSATYEHQFAEDVGNIAATLYYHAIDDHLTEIPFYSQEKGQEKNIISSGLGNIDSAKEYGVKLESSLRLSALGLENTVLNGNVTYRNSSVINPFTQKRQLINNLVTAYWNISLKHDETDLGLAFGARIGTQTAENYNRFDYMARYENRINGSAYIEYKLTKNLKIRIDGYSLLRGKGLRTTTRYNGLFTDPNAKIKWLETRHTKRNTKFVIMLKGQF